MKLARFRALAESLGADFSRWPESERADAKTLLDASEQARVIHEQARAVDKLISAASAAEDAANWRAGAHEQQAALSTLRTGVQQRISQLSQAQSRRVGWLESLRARIVGRFWTLAGTRGVGLAAGSAVVSLLGLVIGWIQTSVPAQPDVLTLLEASPLRLLVH